MRSAVEKASFVYELLISISRYFDFEAARIC
jgi:hypothetical protein